jgi:SM-20-related protein
LEQTGVMALELDALSRVRLGDPPHRWGYLESALAPAAAAELRATFPITGFWCLRHHDGEKDMSFRLRCLVPLGGDRAIEPASLSPAWLALVDELMSDAYRDAFADAIGRPLDEHALELSAWRWGPEAHLGPHADIPRKLASQVFYFNEDWDRAWGGCLQILRSDDPRDVIAELPPTLGSASIVVRSDSSWHAVPPVGAEAVEERLSLVATWQHPDTESPFWTTDGDGTVHCRVPGSERDA